MEKACELGKYTEEPSTSHHRRTQVIPTKQARNLTIAKLWQSCLTTPTHSRR